MENFMVNINNFIENSYISFVKDGVMYQAPLSKVLMLFLTILGTVIVLCSLWGWICSIDDDSENTNERKPRIITSNNK